MRIREKIVVGIKVLLPMLLAVLLGLWPQATIVRGALQTAQAAESRRNYALAAEQLQAALAYLPYRADLWERLGEQQLRAEKPAQAAEALQKAWMLEGISDQGLEHLAQAHLALGEDAGAAAAWQARIQRGAANPETYVSLAAAQRRMGDLNAAAATVREWQARFPQDSQAVYAFATHLMLVSPLEAGAVLEKITALDARYAERAALLQEALGKMQDEPDAAFKMILVGRALGQAGEWGLAAEAFAQATRLSPQYAEAWAMLAEARQQQGLDGRAALEQAQTLAPDSVVVRSLQALYWRRQGKPEVALVIYNQLAALEPKQAAWQAEMGNALSEMGDILSALPHYQQAAMLAQEDPLYWETLARFCVHNGMEVRSIGLPAARQALALRPDDPRMLDLMGWVMLYVQDLPSAERFLQQAIQHDAAFAAAHLHLGQVYLQTGQFAQARTHLLNAVSLDDTGQEARIAQRLLDGLP